jgi:hypothetical protein
MQNAMQQVECASTNSLLGQRLGFLFLTPAQDYTTGTLRDSFKQIALSVR